eukprot:15455152-Alexandrium_andersonii.AAC.1
MISTKQLHSECRLPKTTTIATSPAPPKCKCTAHGQQPSPSTSIANVSASEAHMNWGPHEARTHWCVHGLGSRSALEAHRQSVRPSQRSKDVAVLPVNDDVICYAEQACVAMRFRDRALTCEGLERVDGLPPILAERVQDQQCHVYQHSRRLRGLEPFQSSHCRAGDVASAKAALLRSALHHPDLSQTRAGT